MSVTRAGSLRPETKKAKFLLGHYLFDPAMLPMQDVALVHWSELDWCNFIDKHGRWI